MIMALLVIRLLYFPIKLLINKFIGFDIRDLMKQLRYDRYIKIRSGNTTPDKFKWDHSNYVRF